MPLMPVEAVTNRLIYENNVLHVSINNTIDTGLASQWVGCILQHKSQFKMTVFCFFLLSDTKETMFYGLQLRAKLDYSF
jgi:hypothetical protein